MIRLASIGLVALMICGCASAPSSKPLRVGAAAPARHAITLAMVRPTSVTPPAVRLTLVAATTAPAATAPLASATALPAPGAVSPLALATADAIPRAEGSLAPASATTIAGSAVPLASASAAGAPESSAPLSLAPSLPAPGAASSLALALPAAMPLQPQPLRLTDSLADRVLFYTAVPVWPDGPLGSIVRQAVAASRAGDSNGWNQACANYWDGYAPASARRAALAKPPLLRRER